MKATVELIYKTAPKRELTVDVNDNLKGTRLLDAIDKAVLKADVTDWDRWNLIVLK